MSFIYSKLFTFKTGDKSRFYNPVWQNHFHIKYLSKFLNLDQSYFKSLIAFSDRCLFKSIPESTDRLNIIHRKYILDVLKDDINKTNEKLSEEEFCLIYEKLLKLTNANDVIKQKHQQDVSQIRDN